MRTTTHSSGLWLGLALMLAWGPQVHAQEADDTDVAADASPAQPERVERARALFEEGRAAYEDGRFREALDRFQRAYELAPRAELLFNIGQAHDRLAHPAEARQAYQAYLEARPDAPNRSFVEARIQILAEVSASAAADDGQEEGEAQDGAAEAPLDEALAQEEPPSSPARAGGIVALAVAGGLAVAAAATGIVSLGRRADLEDECPDLRCPAERESDVDALRRSARATDALAGVALAAAAVGVVLLVVGRPEEHDTTVALGLGAVRVTHPF